MNQQQQQEHTLQQQAEALALHLALAQLMRGQQMWLPLGESGRWPRVA